jgi:ABC-type oligopeptide transport system substrate-binding subunit
MKKLLTLGLSLLAVVAVLSLSACAPKEETPGTGTTTEQPAQPETDSGAPAAPEGGAAPAAPEGGTGGGQ